ncbi:hypothetical protein PBI_COLTRANE_37 [Microbacterium phage Coltrane]|uniref:Uncharacterized protein n=4 Tax=Armstrongvirus armstrong TaxID=2734217 RepID=A0A3G2KD42_9CAUD|nr:hypothetical protein HOU45_gp37 [Microbacterium phage Armstrong]AYN55908.1 hypothetical protein PBI_BRAHMS_37 [Microbacterium phage Brahms]AYN57373.1 hypothetical protein PBI_COLTRANE_37 [Microbacterium phage Coltrane]QED11460.1 hypothetical protein SEA_VITAS_37 [Microbacterium phage Vitas]UOK18191.1 hypothetical protein SEA_CLAYDA5_38 [Microbacterium phage Clayda5]AYN56922.1 hypothetical protein PBI_ARMSTRONG_37 [Microbacterium phage Armstrong]
MTDPIDFTQWTLRQLEVGAKYAATSEHGDALLEELERRRNAQ